MGWGGMFTMKSVLGPAVLAAAIAILAASSVGADEIQDRWNDQVREERILELPLLEEFAESLSREGGQLSIVADNGVVVELVDHEACGFTAHYVVKRYIESISSFLVDEMASSDCGTYHLIHKRTGDVASIGMEPEVDAESRQFVTINGGPSEIAGIVIGHETDAGLFIDVVVGIGGYEFAGWIAPDRIALRYATWMDHYLTKAEQEERGFGDGRTRVAELVRQDGVWRLVEIISTPLTSPEESDNAQ